MCVRVVFQDGTDTSQAAAVGVLDPESMYVDVAKRQLIVAGESMAVGVSDDVAAEGRCERLG